MKDLNCCCCHSNSFTTDFCGNRIWLYFLGNGNCFAAFPPLHARSSTCLRVVHILQLQQPGPRTGSHPGSLQLKMQYCRYTGRGVCDGCTRLLNQTRSKWFSSGCKGGKGLSCKWARKFSSFNLFSENPQRSRVTQCDTVSIHAYELGTSIMWLTHE